MTHARPVISWLGVVLILVGVFLVLDRLDVISLDNWIILWAGLLLLGFFSALRGFSDNKAGKIFWGTFLFLFSLFFLLRSAGLIDVYAHMLPPAFFLAIGISFIMLFIHDPKEWGLLIPGLALGGIGVILILVEYGYMYEWDVWEGVRTYWPVILILLGVSIVLRRKSRKQAEQTTAQ